jgi:inhibitor of Bruton tyrosine kinase
VFVRSRATKAGQSVSGKAFKFQRVPNLQRVTQVCANATGAFGALRVDHSPKPIDIRGNTISQDLATVRPYLSMYLGERPKSQLSHHQSPDPFAVADEEVEDISVDDDIRKLLQLLDILVYEKKARLESDPFIATPDEDCFPHDADVLVCTASGAVFPAHRVILGARAWRLRAVLEDSKIIQDGDLKISIRLSNAKSASTARRLTRIEFNGCQPISVLIFLHYIYSDDLLAIWDRRVSIALEQHLRKLRIKPLTIKSELLALVTALELHHLAQAIQSPAKRIPAPSMARAMEDLFQAVQNPVPKQSALIHDVVLQLSDKDVLCHSAVLRARSAFFADFFDGEVWTVKRRDANGVIVVDMKHLKWHVMEYVLRFVCCGGDEEMFYTLGMYCSPRHTLPLNIYALQTLPIQLTRF